MHGWVLHFLTNIINFILTLTMDKSIKYIQIGAISAEKVVNEFID